MGALNTLLKKIKRPPQPRTHALTSIPFNVNLQNRAERVRWKNSVEAIKKRWKIPIKNAVSELFTNEGKLVMAEYRRTGYITDTINAASKNKPQWAILLENIWTHSGKDTAKLVYSAHIKSLNMDDGLLVNLADVGLGWEQYVRGYFRSETGLKKVDDISNYSKLNIEAAINRGMVDGLSKDQIADKIGVMYDKMSEGRAMNIARTEVNAATNYASLSTMQNYGNATTKTWMCMMENSREWHIDADGQTVAIDAQFDVGDESLDCPGDGGPDNSVNCNCDMEYGYERPTEGG